jgi:hypothetical protein
MTVPFLRFDVTAANRAEPGAGSARLDVYFGKGTRLSFLPGVFPGNFFHIAGRHAWSSVESWDPYTGFGVQVAFHGAGRQRVVYVLTVHGVRHRYTSGCGA